MFPNLSDRAVAIIAALSTFICLTLLLIIGPLPPADGAEKSSRDSAVGRTFTTKTLCDERGKCSRVRLNMTGPGALEGRQRARDIRMATPCRVKYTGWTTRQMDNLLPDAKGYKYMSGPSLIREDRWHVFQVKCPQDERGI